MIGEDVTPDWLDQVAVNRCLAGQPVGRPLHQAEKYAIARAAHRRGDSLKQIGRLVGCSGDHASRLVKEAACSE